MFARLFPGRRYLLLCGGCLDPVNAQIRHRLREGSCTSVRHTKPVPPLVKLRHNWSRLTASFKAPVRMLLNRCIPAMRTS